MHGEGGGGAKEGGKEEPCMDTEWILKATQRGAWNSPVSLALALHADLSQRQGDEKTYVPGHHQQPKVVGQGRTRGELTQQLCNLAVQGTEERLTTKRRHRNRRRDGPAEETQHQHQRLLLQPFPFERTDAWDETDGGSTSAIAVHRTHHRRRRSIESHETYALVTVRLALEAFATRRAERIWDPMKADAMESDARRKSDGQPLDFRRPSLRLRGSSTSTNPFLVDACMDRSCGIVYVSSRALVHVSHARTLPSHSHAFRRRLPWFVHSQVLAAARRGAVARACSPELHIPRTAIIVEAMDARIEGRCVRARDNFARWMRDVVRSAPCHRRTREPKRCKSSVCLRGNIGHFTGMPRR